MPRQRLILLFDGTWNDPEVKTNVYELARLINDYDDNIRQRFFYHEGLGTGKFDRFRGGIFGMGLTQHLLDGYEWLSKRHTDPDEIWLFGFSRGAYTARSLAGLIRKCGLLEVYSPKVLDETMRLYRNKDLAPDSKECKIFRNNYSKEVRIKFIGVWDTVGSLGIPGTFISEQGQYAWHDTELSGSVDYAYHAVALDEHREVYRPALWVSEDGQKKAGNHDVEQRWFIGAHANVGGGYGPDDLLARISLKWITEKARDLGLKLKDLDLASDAWKTEPKNSYEDFLHGWYARFRWMKQRGNDGRYYRSFRHGHGGKPAVHVTVDPSVWQRWRDPAFDYRPRTLLDAGVPLPDIGNLP